MKCGTKSLRFRGAMLWNTLNDDAKNIMDKMGITNLNQFGLSVVMNL